MTFTSFYHLFINSKIYCFVAAYRLVISLREQFSLKGLGTILVNFYFFIFIVYKGLVAYLMIKRNLNVSNRVIRYRPQNSFCMFITGVYVNKVCGTFYLHWPNTQVKVIFQTNFSISLFIFNSIK